VSNHEENSKGLWQEIKGAIRGTEADYTKIRLGKAILLLAIPMVLELVMESTFAIVDIYFVGRLGASAVATVGLTETFLFLLYSMSMGLSIAVTAIVARRIGEKDAGKAAISAMQSVYLGLLFSIPFALAGIFFAKDLLRLMGADPWTLDMGYRYAQWMLGGNVVIILLFVMNAIFRGAGDAAIAMRILFISNGINIILDPLLIFGLGPFPELGIEGAAIATNIGRGTGVLCQLWILFRGGKHIRVTLAQIRWQAGVMLQILKTSVGGIGQMLVGMMSWIFIVRILAELGSEVVAGATIAVRIMMFTGMPAWGLSNAAATLVGQNLGAGEPERAESAVWKIGLYNMFYLIGIALLFFFFNRQLMSVITDDARVIEVGAEWLRILSYSYFVYGWWMVSVQAFNGAGDTQTPTWINLVFFWLIQIPLSWFMSIHLGMEQTGVFWAVFISETAVGLFTLWLFTKGNWKKMVV
jgi:putative MATE family efflux protein